MGCECGGDHRGSVENQHPAVQGLAGFLHLLRRGDAVAHVAVAREEPLQGPGRDIGFALELARGARRRGQPSEHLSASSTKTGRDSRYPSICPIYYLGTCAAG